MILNKKNNKEHYIILLEVVFDNKQIHYLYLLLSRFMNTN